MAATRNVPSARQDACTTNRRRKAAANEPRQMERAGNDLKQRRIGGLAIDGPHPSPLPEGEGTQTARRQSQSPAARSGGQSPVPRPRRRGDGGNGVVQGIHAKLLIRNCRSMIGSATPISNHPSTIINRLFLPRGGLACRGPSPRARVSAPCPPSAAPSSAGTAARPSPTGSTR